MIELSRAVLGRLSEQLSELIEQQSAEVFKRAGLVIPVKSSSLLSAIAALGPVSASDLVRALQRSHQLIQQKVPKLVALGLVIRRPASDDQRVILIEITDKGREQLALFDRLASEFDRAYGEMEEDAGPVFDGINRAISALKSRPLIDRIVG
jgi:DNA-binding MarR family transcriptional regulator